MIWAKNRKILAIIMIGIILSITISAILYSYNESKGISAAEGLNKANELAEQWNSSAVLVYVQAMGEIYRDGKCEKWGYSYSNNNSNINQSKGFVITVFADFTYVTGERESPPSPHPIIIWKIDSDDAIQIAKSNPEITQWLDKYNNANIQSMVLTANSNASGWGIAWNDPGFMDDPHTAVININAITGEVLDVYVQM